jgi:hypothetical protein
MGKLEKDGLECIDYQAMKIPQFLLIVIDVALALAATYLLFPSLLQAAASIPIALAALFAAGIIFAVYGD